MILKHRDRELLRFEWIEPQGVRVLSVNESERNNFRGTWAECNLYDNPFSKAVSLVAFSGMGPSVETGWTSSPEFTTNGMLAKCWRIIGDDVLLYKGGTDGAANAGFEPYSEFYASQIAEVMGLDHVNYGLSRFKGRICSTS